LIYIHSFFYYVAKWMYIFFNNIMQFLMLSFLSSLASALEVLKILLFESFPIFFIQFCCEIIEDNENYNSLSECFTKFKFFAMGFFLRFSNWNKCVIKRFLSFLMIVFLKMFWEFSKFANIFIWIFFGHCCIFEVFEICQRI
jgi:hypothetical protein